MMVDIENSFSNLVVGVTAIILSQGRILLAKRAGALGFGCWETPGGRLELGETVLACAVRETAEETGIMLSEEDFVSCGFTESFFSAEKLHALSLVVCTDLSDREVIPRRTEPEKLLTPWQWFDLSNLPPNLFLPVRNFFDK